MTSTPDLVDQQPPFAAAARLAPLEPGRTLILRPRLLAALQARFRARLTTLTTGPGFGKTSMLVQAVGENRMAPRGQDIWLTCRDSDTAGSSLAEALGAAFRLPGPTSWNPAAVIDRLVATIWTRSPEQVTIILDDAHLVSRGSPGAALLISLLEQLPANGHLVLAGRDPLPIPTARLTAQGQLTELRDADLTFTPEEITEFAAVRRVPRELVAGSGGWPALAELAVSAGGERVLDFLWEELLSALPARRRHDLAALCLFSPFDEEIASALAGHPIDIAATVADLPLVSGRQGEAQSLHPLWQPALARLLSDDEAAVARVRAAAVLHARGNVDAAVRLLVRAQRWDQIRQIVCETAMYTHPLVAPDVLDNWYHELSAAERARPEGVLLRALAVRAHDLIRAVPLFSGAAEEFRADRNVLGEAGALTHLAHIGWWLDDEEAIAAAAARISELAAAFPPLNGVATMGRILAADAIGDPDAALELLRGFPDADVAPTMVYGVEWLWAWTWLITGEPDRAEPHARETVHSAPGTFRAPALNVLLRSLWHTGRIAEALEVLPRFTEATIATGRDLASVFERSQCALLLAFTGRTAQAREHRDVARLALPGASHAPMAEIAFVLGDAAVRIAEGDEDGARAVLTAELAARPLSGGRTRWHRMFPALSYVLVPETRADWDAAQLGPAHAHGRELARALVALRERGEIRAVAELDLTEPGRLRAQLPAPWVVQLAVAAVACGSGAARDLLAAVEVDVRPALHALATAGPRRLARAARELLAAQPVVPAHQLELRVLGPLELRRDGVVVDHPDLRRERVRQLLQFLALAGPAPRATAAAALWPDLAPASAARNLRVTLTYLQRVLEPDRLDGDPPAFLSAGTGLLELRRSEALRVDLHEFEAELDAAEQAEAQAAPSLALQHLRRALPRYRGDLVVEATGVDWAELERDRLRVRYVAAAVRAGELLMATGDRQRPLELALRALRVDPFAEAAYGLLIAVRLDRGEPDAARQAHRRCLQMLAELGLPPTHRTEMLARRLIAAGRFPAATG